MSEAIISFVLQECLDLYIGVWKDRIIDINRKEIIRALDEYRKQFPMFNYRVVKRIDTVDSE